jgi:hypothetical protein
MTWPGTLEADYFDTMYQAAADPWGFVDCWYKRRKYAISLAQLLQAVPQRLRAGLLHRRAHADARRALRPPAVVRSGRGARSTRPPGAPATCRTSGWSNARSPRCGPPGASISARSPRSCTTSATATSSRSWTAPSARSSLAGPCSPCTGDTGRCRDTGRLPGPAGRRHHGADIRPPAGPRSRRIQPPAADAGPNPVIRLQERPAQPGNRRTGTGPATAPWCGPASGTALPPRPAGNRRCTRSRSPDQRCHVRGPPRRRS